MVSTKNKFIFVVIFLLFSAKPLLAEKSWYSILKASIEQSTVCKDNRIEYQRKIENLKQIKKWYLEKIAEIRKNLKI